MLNTYNMYLEARSIVAMSDMFYSKMISLISLVRPMQSKYMVNAETELVIEGFPRSANTYMASWFELAQRRPTAISSHLHESFQVRFAERENIPCIVLVRRPLDAVASAILRDNRMQPRSLLRNYKRFYREVVRVHKNSVVVRFEDVVMDANKAIDELNIRYGTCFSKLPDEDHHKVAREVKNKHLKMFNIQDVDPLKIAAPTAEKETAKARIAESIKTNTELLRLCEEVYEEVLGLARRSASA